MIKKIQEIYDSYSTSDAKQVVEYMWDIYDARDNNWSLERVIETIKHVSNNSENMSKKISKL